MRRPTARSMTTRCSRACLSCSTSVLWRTAVMDNATSFSSTWTWLSMARTSLSSHSWTRSKYTLREPMATPPRCTGTPRTAQIPVDAARSARPGQRGSVDRFDERITSSSMSESTQGPWPDLAWAASRAWARSSVALAYRRACSIVEQHDAGAGGPEGVLQRADDGTEAIAEVGPTESVAGNGLEARTKSRLVDVHWIPTFMAGGCSRTTTPSGRRARDRTVCSGAASVRVVRKHFDEAR